MAMALFSSMAPQWHPAGPVPQLRVPLWSEDQGMAGIKQALFAVHASKKWFPWIMMELLTPNIDIAGKANGIR